MKKLRDLFDECKNIVFYDNYSSARKWKESGDKRVLIGIIPNYFPREIIHAANGFAVGIIGEDLKLPLKKENNDTKSACSMLGGLFEMVQSDKYDHFDGFIFPSQCSTLSASIEIGKIREKGKFIKYINFPQYFQTIISNILNHNFVAEVLGEIYKISGIELTAQSLLDSIDLYKENLSLTEKIFALSEKQKEHISEDDIYYTVLAGLLIPIEEHNNILRNIFSLLDSGDGRNQDIFNVYYGAYC